MKRLKLHLYVCLIVFLHHLSHCDCQTSYPVRLTGGSNIYQGQVEVLHCTSNTSCTWRNVCSTGWDSTESTVVCKQLDLYDGRNSPSYSFISSNTSAATRIHCANSSYTKLNSCTVTSVSSCGARTRVTCSSPPQVTSITTRFLHQYRQYYYISATIQWSVSLSGRPATKYFISCSNGVYSHSQYSSQIRLYDLLPYAYYNCRVSGIDTNGVIGQSVYTNFQTPPGVPRKAPSGLRYSALQSRSISLQWEQIPDADKAGPRHYITYSVKMRGYRCNSVSQPHTTSTHLRINNLCPNSVYSIAVRACVNSSNSLCGSYSTEIEIQTLEDAPSTVNNLTCNARSPTQVNVTWKQPSQPNGVIRHYEVVLQDLNTTENTTTFVNGQTTSVSVNKLHPNHNYSCSVAAHTVVRGTYAAAVYVPLPPFRVPKHFTCSEYNSTTLQVTWIYSGLQEAAEYYLASVWNTDTNKVVYSSVTQVSTQATLLIISLAPYNNYGCSVTAYNSQDGIGMFGTVHLWIPQAVQFGHPTELQYTSLTKTSIRFQWRLPHVNPNYDHVNIGNYNITVLSNQTDVWRVIISEIHPLNYYQLGSLHPNYYYKIEVSAVANGNMRGPPSILYVQTPEDAPSGPPQNLSIFNIISSSFMMRWNKPPLETQNGKIIGYNINVTDWNGATTTLLNTTNMTIMVSALRASTTYYVSVSARTSVGVGPFSQLVSVTTKKNSGITNVNTSNSVAVVIIVLCSITSVILLIMSITCGLSTCMYRNKRKNKKYSVDIKTTDVDHSDQITLNLNTNSCGPSSSNYEYSTLHMYSEEEKKVKPPAVPPKTYLEDYITTSSITPCQSNEELNKEVDDSCSVGSDSLYDMKLESVAEINPHRSMTTGSDPTAELFHPSQTKITSSKYSRNEQNDHDYQKLDKKTLSRPAAYEEVHVVSKQGITASGSNGETAKLSTTSSHYESLKLNTLNKQSHYQQIVLKETCQ